MKVLVAGATGATGRRIVQELVDQSIPVRGMVRNLEAAQAILPDQTELVVGNVSDPSSLATAIAGCTAVICATGAKPSLDPTGPYKVDYEGTKNLVNAAKANGIDQFVLVSSLCTSQLLHPLNLFFLILHWKKQAEEYLQSSGLTYTIVRPGGLKNEDTDDSVVMSGADTLFEGSIPRTQVAKVCVAALSASAARNKIVEIVATTEAPHRAVGELFAGVS